MKERAVEILRAAKQLIVDEHNWIKGEYARDADGRCVPTHHIRACKFCAVGALSHVSGLSVKNVESAKDFMPGVFLNQAASEELQAPPHIVNDCRGHNAVLAMYDRAIQLAEAADA